MNRKLLWLLPAALLAVAGGALLALPSFVAAPRHRPAMERFASALTGRRVHIGGNLSLTLLPQPTLTATRITIAGPDDEVISAKALALDIAVPPLLRGQLAVQTLNLDSPVIVFPWPLPGGPRAAAPPPWLAALHAHLANASITLGGLAFTKVDADLFTGPGGAVSLSGNGRLLGRNVTLSLALGQTALDGSAPLSLQASSGDGTASADFTGTLTAQSHVTGQLTASLPGGVTGSATIAADGGQLAFPALTLQRGHEILSGHASLALDKPALTADLFGQKLDLGQLAALPARLAALPADVTLNADTVTLAGRTFPALQISLSTGPAGATVHALNLSLPGGGQLTGSGTMAAGGQLAGELALAVPDSAALLGSYKLPPLPAWPMAHLTATLGGTLTRPVLQKLAGTLGADHVTGSLVLSAGHAAGQLGFDHLNLAPFAAWVRQPPPAFTADMQITAASAEAGPVKLSHLAVDAALDGTLDVRRISASLYGGLAAGSFSLDAGGQVSAAQGFLDLPSASPLAQLIPPAFRPPAAMLTPRLTLLFAARGPADALAASAVAHLGEFTFTASPVIDLVHGSASGPLTAQHPEAILVARLFGADRGLVFPGAGSAALRASFTFSASRYGLDDFILNFGALNASGRLMVSKGAISGQIDAGTILLPPLPAGLQLPTSLPLQGRLALSAQTIGYNGRTVLGTSAASLNWSNSGAALDVAQADLGGGSLSGSLGLTLSPAAAPAFTAKLLAKNIDTGQLALPLRFPYPLTAGTLNGNAALTAHGFGLKSLAATLAGSASLTATSGVLQGFDLAAFADRLGMPNPARGLYRALVSGATPFASLTLAGTFADGNCTLTAAQLKGPAGEVSGSGGIDLYDNTQALRLTLTPAGVNPPVSATLLVLGSWTAPKHIAHMKAALGWVPAKGK